MLPDNARVYSSDKKEIGKVSSVNAKYFVSLKQGLVMDEEYRIPIQAVAGVLPDEEALIVEVGLSEEQLRHGYEIIEGRPNSDLVKGKVNSELRMPTGKQLIRYSAIEYFENVRISKTGNSLPSGYACDVCAARFDNPENLDKHRSKAHKGPVGL